MAIHFATACQLSDVYGVSLNGPLNHRLLQRRAAAAAGVAVGGPATLTGWMLRLPPAPGRTRPLLHRSRSDGEGGTPAGENFLPHLCQKTEVK